MKLKKWVTTLLLVAGGLTVVIGLATGITTAIVENNTAGINYLSKYIIPVDSTTSPQYEWVHFYGSKVYYFQNECFTKSGKSKKAVLVQFKEPFIFKENQTITLPWHVNYQDSSYFVKQIDSHAFMNLNILKPLNMTLVIPMTVNSLSINNKVLDLSLPTNELMNQWHNLIPDGFFAKNLFKKIVVLNPDLYNQIQQHQQLFNPTQELIFQNQIENLSN